MDQYDEIKINPNVLEDVANFIVLYCNAQHEIMDDYLQKMNALSNEWQDDETMGKVLQEVRMLTNSVEKVMSLIRFKYPQYFKKKAEEIRSRNNTEV